MVVANDGELVARLHFEAEHTNVLVVTVELLNGCLASTEIESMTAKVINPVIPEFPVSLSVIIILRMGAWLMACVLRQRIEYHYYHYCIINVAFTKPR